MSSITSFVERTVQPRLHHLPRFRPSASLFAALVALSSVTIIGCASSTSLPTLPTTLCTALVKLGTTGVIPPSNSLFNIISRVLNTACFRVRIHIKVPIQWRSVFDRGVACPRSDDTYATPRAETKYWRVADRYRRRLYGGTGASTSSYGSTPSRETADVPLVIYYTPRMLPFYRDQSGSGRTSREKDVHAREVRISPRTFCKWHWMVFQDLNHPTFAQAATQMKYYSNRDLREIQRIARLLPDEQVFGSKETRKTRRSRKYSEMWQSWLENKGVDLTIVFE